MILASVDISATSLEQEMVISKGLSMCVLFVYSRNSKFKYLIIFKRHPLPFECQIMPRVGVDIDGLIKE